MREQGSVVWVEGGRKRRREVIEEKERDSEQGLRRIWKKSGKVSL